jgi:hypothetical protein
MTHPGRLVRGNRQHRAPPVQHTQPRIRKIGDVFEGLAQGLQAQHRKGDAAEFPDVVSHRHREADARLPGVAAQAIAPHRKAGYLT